MTAFYSNLPRQTYCAADVGGFHEYRIVKEGVSVSFLASGPICRIAASVKRNAGRPKFIQHHGWRDFTVLRPCAGLVPETGNLVFTATFGCPDDHAP